MLSTFAQWQDHGGITGLDGYENYIGENPADMLVMPVSRNRDSGPLDESNFATALKELGGESDTVQVHSFNHWACGWYELILIDPTDTERVAIAEQIVERLENYPVLDEDDIDNREYGDFLKSWGAWGASDFRKAILRELDSADDGELETALDDVSDDGLREFYMDRANGPYYAESSGICIPCIDEVAAKLTLDDVLPDYGPALERDVLAKSLLTGVPDLLGPDMAWYWADEPLELDIARELLAA